MARKLRIYEGIMKH